jgi:flagellar biogenesis protein FliO
MMPLLLALSAAMADPGGDSSANQAGADPAFDRLFGGDAAAQTIDASEAPAGGFAWPALLAGAGIAAAWHLRKKALNTGNTAGMRVVQRQSFGDRSSLLLVEVDDGQGGTRRLLVGSGQGGLNLVQDLGLTAPAPDTNTPRVTDSFAAELDAADLGRATQPGTRSAGPALPAAAPNAAAIRQQAADFSNLLDDVLAERGLGATPAAAPVNTIVGAGPPTGDMDDDDTLANDFFRVGATAARGRFFTEDDLAPAAESIETAEPARGPARVAAAITAPAAALPPAPPTIPAPAAIAPTAAAALWPPLPTGNSASPTFAPAALWPPNASISQPIPAANAANPGLRAIVGGRNPEAPARVINAEAPRNPGLATLVKARVPAGETPRAVEIPVSAAPAPVTNPPAIAPISERSIVGPPLQDPILLAQPASAVAAPSVPALTVARSPAFPPPPAPSALDAARARLQKMASASQPPAPRPTEFDHLVRRFDAAVAGGKR